MQADLHLIYVIQVLWLSLSLTSIAGCFWMWSTLMQLENSLNKRTYFQKDEDIKCTLIIFIGWQILFFSKDIHAHIFADGLSYYSIGRWLCRWVLGYLYQINICYLNKRTWSTTAFSFWKSIIMKRIHADGFSYLPIYLASFHMVNALIMHVKSMILHW